MIFPINLMIKYQVKVLLSNYEFLFKNSNVIQIIQKNIKMNWKMI